MVHSKWIDDGTREFIGSQKATTDDLGVQRSKDKTMDEFEVIVADPSTRDVQYLEDRHYEFNREATGIWDGRGLGVFVRKSDGQIVAGAAGHTWGGTCELRQVWVQQELRGKGLGKQLLEAAMSEAERRGCWQLLICTHSFKAPGFYRKLGFEEVARLEQYPHGHAQIFFRKHLRPEGCRTTG